MNNLNEIFEFNKKLRSLKWTQYEYEILPEYITKRPVYLALEFIDERKDLTMFDIVYYCNKEREEILKQHIIFTSAFYNWNFKEVIFNKEKYY